jgi:hypothetical protein
MACLLSDFRLLVVFAIVLLTMCGEDAVRRLKKG